MSFTNTFCDNVWCQQDGFFLRLWLLIVLIRIVFAKYYLELLTDAQRDAIFVIFSINGILNLKISKHFFPCSVAFLKIWEISFGKPSGCDTFGHILALEVFLKLGFFKDHLYG